MPSHSLLRCLMVPACLLAPILAPAQTQTQPPAANSRPYLSQSVLHLIEHPDALQQFGKDTIRTDADGNVLVQLAFNAASREAIVSSAIKLGARLTSPNQLRPEILPLWIAPSQLRALAAIPGVRAITLPLRPIFRKDPIPAEASAPMHFNLVPTADSPANVTIGVISDSYDACGSCSDTPKKDIAAGELPGAANPNGDGTPVFVLTDSPAGTGTDEGRAVLEIIYGLVPKARLCFATADTSEDAFAQAIIDLQDPAKGCGANVIMDDVEYLDEPFFSDGPIAQAIDTVSAKGVTYISAEGNDGPGLLDATFTPISDANARDGKGGSNFKFGGIPASLTAGGFYNFGTTAHPNVSLPLTSPFSGINDLILQWDDPFVAGKITANYNLLVFDSVGNYLSGNSGTDIATSTGEPLQFAEAESGQQIAITLAKTPDGTFSQHLRLVAPDHIFDTTDPNTPSISGHPAASTSLATSTYYYGTPTTPETYDSVGPFTVYFDDSGNRLATPIVRQQPAIAGVDGLDTSFFGGSDTDSDGFPNFYGTSAAAATIAAEAAIVIQFLGGPTKATPAAVRAAITNSAASPTWNDAVGFGLANPFKATSPAAEASTALTVSPSSLSVGQSTTLKATVTGTSGTPSGTVTFSADGVTLATIALNGSGVASLTATSNGLAPATYPVIATYNGNSSYNSSVSPPVNIVLAKAPTATTLTAAPTTVTPPASVTLTATVTRSATGAAGTPTGSVTFSTGGTTLASVKLNSKGVAILTAPSAGYPAGAYPIKAAYNGDSGDTTSTSSAVTVTVK